MICSELIIPQNPMWVIAPVTDFPSHRLVLISHPCITKSPHLFFLFFFFPFSIQFITCPKQTRRPLKAPTCQWPYLTLFHPHPHQKVRPLKPRQVRERPRSPHSPHRLVLRQIYRKFILCYECIPLNTVFQQSDHYYHCY